MKSWVFRLLPLGLFALLVGFFYRGLSLDPHDIPSVQLGKTLPHFELPPLERGAQSFSSQSLRGRNVLLTVWASWCAACIDEQRFLLQLAQQGWPIYGLNYKDSADNATQWLATWGNPFQAVGVDAAGKVAIDLGVYGAPETFLIDAQGVIRHRHAGVLDEAVWQHDFVPKIQTMEHAA